MLLRYLVQHEGRAVSRKKMLEDVWNLREDTDTRAIDHFIARLARLVLQGMVDVDRGGQVEFGVAFSRLGLRDKTFT